MRRARYERISALSKSRQIDKQPVIALRWPLQVMAGTFFISAAFSLGAGAAIGGISTGGAFAVLLLFIGIGVLFDILGVAVTAAELPPLLSMASRRVPGAEQAIWLLRHAERVSNVCNDVIGDICGIISGTTVAAIVAAAAMRSALSGELYISIALSALTAAVTVGAKAFGKYIALAHSRDIVLLAGRMLGWVWRPRHKRKGNWT